MDGCIEHPDSRVAQSIRIPIIQTPQYTVYFQSIRINDREYTFVHCDVRDWNLNVLKSLRSDWNCLIDLHNGPLLALSELEDDKHQKFLELFDFKYLQQITGEDSIVRNLYIIMAPKMDNQGTKTPD